MNGDRADRQIDRILTMARQANSTCTVEVVPGELDSIHLTFHCSGQRHSVAWVGAWLETLDADALWRELDLATRGGIRKPQESQGTSKA
jgi:hypothetical protein